MEKEKKGFFVVAVGASAGGLNAISELVSQLPEDLNAAVFIVIHLSKVGIGEFIITRLQKYTSFNCIIPKNGDEIRRGYIYVAPPDTHLLMNEGKIVLGHGPAENRWRPSIDVLFRSAGVNFTNHVIGIILTGYLNDGTAGMLAIKRTGGVCIVQDPNEAEYPDMPLSVLETIEVDYCVPLPEMGETIVSIVETSNPEEIAVQPDVLKEAEIAEKTITSIQQVAQLGNKSLYTCPDCGGGLWSMENDNLNRYRCHIGHSFSERDLVIKQSESIESTLWVALRMMEERKMLLNKISADETRKGLKRLANVHKEKSDELDAHIDKLKELLFAAQKD